MQSGGMRDWAIDYLLHVMEVKGWSANRLATEAGVASSTIARPLREKDWAFRLSRDTINKVAAASGVDPAAFAPRGMAEGGLSSAVRPDTVAARSLRALDQAQPMPSAFERNEIKIAVVGPLAQIVATVDRAGLAKLRQKLDIIESMLDD